MEREYERYGIKTSAYVPGFKRTKHAGNYRVDLPAGTWGLRTIEVHNIVKQQHRSTFTVQNGPATYAYKIPKKNGISLKEAQQLPRGGSLMRVVGTTNEEVPSGYQPGDGADMPTENLQDAPDSRTLFNYNTGFIPGNGPDMNNDGKATLRRAPLGLVSPPVLDGREQVIMPDAPPPPPPPSMAVTSKIQQIFPKPPVAEKTARPELLTGIEGGVKLKPAVPRVVVPSKPEEPSVMSQIKQGVKLKRPDAKSPKARVTDPQLLILQTALKGRRMAMDESPATSPRGDEWL